MVIQHEKISQFLNGLDWGLFKEEIQWSYNPKLFKEKIQWYCYPKLFSPFCFCNIFRMSVSHQNSYNGEVYVFFVTYNNRVRESWLIPTCALLICTYKLTFITSKHFSLLSIIYCLLCLMVHVLMISNRVQQCHEDSNCHVTLGVPVGWKNSMWCWSYLVVLSVCTLISTW